jgi:acyl-CoA synthetase (AMP-forming)/AMP-acid ligase II
MSNTDRRRLLQRLGTVTRFSNIFLASDASSYLTGITLPVRAACSPAEEAPVISPITRPDCRITAPGLLYLTEPARAVAEIDAVVVDADGEDPLFTMYTSGPDLDEAAVLAHCRGTLARVRLPKRAVFTDVIPRNPTGKALKRLLREQFSFDAPE